MNFDNLVEDVKVEGGIVHADGNIFLTNTNKLKSIILKYILADRAASGEPVAWIHKNDECVCYVDFSPKSVTHTASTEPLFTRAQPTPARIAEIQAAGFEMIAERQDDISDRLWLKAMASRLRKGEPL